MIMLLSWILLLTLMSSHRSHPTHRLTAPQWPACHFGLRLILWSFVMDPLVGCEKCGGGKASKLPVCKARRKRGCKKLMNSDEFREFHVKKRGGGSPFKEGFSFRCQIIFRERERGREGDHFNANSLPSSDHAFRGRPGATHSVGAPAAPLDGLEWLEKLIKTKHSSFFIGFSSLSIACNLDLNTATDRTTSALQLQTLHYIDEPMMDTEGNHLLKCFVYIPFQGVQIFSLLISLARKDHRTVLIFR